MTITVSSPHADYRPLLLDLLEQVAPHIQGLDLYLPPTSIARVWLQARVVDDYIELLDQLSARIQRWDKLQELHLPVTSGKGLSRVRTHLFRAPRLKTVLLQPLNIVSTEKDGMDSSLTTEKLDLSGITSIAIVPLFPPSPPTTIQIPPHLEGLAYAALRQTCEEIDKAILANVPNLERLAISQRGAYQVPKLAALLKTLPKLKALYIADTEMATSQWQMLSPFEHPIETLWLDLTRCSGSMMMPSYDVSGLSVSGLSCIGCLILYQGAPLTPAGCGIAVP